MELGLRRVGAMLGMAVVVALGVQVLGMQLAWAGVRAASGLDNVEISRDGLTFTADLDLDAKTACVTDIVDPDVPTEVAIPASLEHDGEAYAVTEVLFTRSNEREHVVGLTLPDTLTDLNNSNFRKFPNITEMVIPGSVKVFDGTFQNMKNLVSLTFGEGVEEIAANSMLRGCDALTTLTLPESLKRITKPASFAGAAALEKIVLPEGVEVAEGSLLSDCTSLKSIELPSSMTKIPSNMFSDCTALTTVVAKAPVTSVGSGAFSGCSALVEIPSLSRVTDIGSYAFHECGALTGPVDLSRVSTMGEKAFYNCGRLVGDIDLSGLSVVPAQAFSYDGGITSVRLSDELTKIGTWAFLGTGLSEVALPDTLTSIGTYAFWKAGGLGGTVRIPDAVTSVGAHAFEDTVVERFEIGEGLRELDASAIASTALKEVTFDNSKDDVTIKGALPEGVAVSYAQPSIEDSVGDTISEEAGSPTLQKAVNEAAKNGGVVNIEKNIKLKTPVSIPKGKTVTIASDDSFQIAGVEQPGDIKNLFVVEEGGSLVVGGDVTLSGRYNTGSVVLANGAFELAGNAVVTASKLQDDRANGLEATGVGVIDARGEKASIKVTGGSISGNALVGNGMAYSGIVRVSEGASFEMSGGEICKNRALNASALSSSSGVLLYGDARADISGGCISDNVAHRGSAVMLFGNAADARTSLTLSGEAVLSGNTCTSTGKVVGSGAVHVEDNAEFMMTGGTITGNSGVQGAGVCVVDGNLQNAQPEYRTAFTMMGGSISKNTGSTGGGVYSYSNGVELTAGAITDNTAHNMGGGVYCEGNYDYYSTLHISNALISGNTARQGGGMWFCATGEVTAHATGGAAIFDNTARDADGQKAAGDDFVFSAREAEGHPATLANRLLGGGSVAWYEDGGVYLPSTDVYPTTSEATPRYGAEGASTEPVDVSNSVKCLALKAVPLSEEVKKLAEDEAEMVIVGNTADKGGGIGSNGGVEIGDESVTGVTVDKAWKGDMAGERPASIMVELLHDGVVVDTATLTADGNWTHEFANLPISDANGDAYAYTVAEVPVPGYSAEITGDAANGYIIVNTKDEAPVPDQTDRPTQPDNPSKPDDQPHVDGPAGDAQGDDVDRSSLLPTTGDPGVAVAACMFTACLGGAMVFGAMRLRRR